MTIDCKKRDSGKRSYLYKIIRIGYVWSCAVSLYQFSGNSGTVLHFFKGWLNTLPKEGGWIDCYCFLVLPKVYMNSGSTHKDEVGRIWDLFKLSWALNLSMSIMLLHWPCCFFFLEAKIFLVCGFAQKEHYQKFDPDFLSKLIDLVTPNSH